MRCLATAETLASASWDVAFVSSEETRTTAPALGRAGIAVCENEDDNILSGADVIVFDHYGIDAAEERRIAGSIPLRVAFDDLPERVHDVDLLVDATPGRAATSYDGLMAPGAELLAGARYAQIRRCWWEQRTPALARRARMETANRILVSMGATDPTNATAKVLAALAAADRKLEIDIVLGPGAPHRAAVRAMIGTLGRLHIDPVDLPRLVAEADLAIGAAGSSCFERACLGLPAIIVVLADNQVELAQAFDTCGAARTVSHSRLNDPADFARIVTDILDDDAAREVMSELGAKLVDGRGPQRLLLRLTGRRVAAGGPISVRAAEASDQDWLFKLQSRPETRRFAINPAPPTPSEHAMWMARTLSNPDRLLAIVEWDGMRAGTVRLDRLSQKTPAFEVSIAVEPERHGHGIGTAALGLVRKIIPKADILATVLTDNRASQALFERAGYRREAEERFRSVVA